MHDCKNCIYGEKPELGCSNRKDAICVKELKIGDKIEFFDICGNVIEVATIKGISKTLNFDFEERGGWGINGLYVTNIKILNR